MIRIIVFNATFNNISVTSWESVLLVEETGMLGGKPPTFRKSLPNFVTYWCMIKNVTDWYNCLSFEGFVSGRGGNKLRTYYLFNNRFETKKYCKIALTFSYKKSAFAKFKCEIAPLRIRSGSF